MAADSATLGMLGGGASGPDLVSGRSPPRPDTGPSGAGARPSAALGCGNTSGGARKASAPARQGTQPSSGEPSRSGTAGTSGSGNANSDSEGARSAGKSGSAASGKSSGADGSGRQSARSSSASNTETTQATSQGSAAATAPGSGFPAALAQSLAATAADGGATPDTSAGKSAAESGGAESSGPSKGHSAADPVSSALILLEQALAGALAGIQAAAASSGAAAASTSSASSANGGAIGGPGKSGAAALESLLTQSLASDAKGAGSNPAPAAGGSPAAAPRGAASTAAAGLTAAAQLSSAPHPASQQGVISSGMALASPVGTSAWTDELGAKVTWMASQGIESASLHLSPEHLGPLQVSISVHNGQASVWFGAAQPDTRTALQQSLPQLRQLFANHGLTLADTGVSREPPRGHSHQSPVRAAASVSAIAAAGLESTDTRPSIAGGLGLLDTYA